MSTKNRLCLGALTLVWGFGFLFIKVALRDLNPYDVVLGGLLTAALALRLFSAAVGLRLPRERATWAHFVVMAMLTNIAPYLLFAWAEIRITAGLAAVINGTTPLFTFGLALATRTERANVGRLIGLAIGLGGVVVLAGPWAGTSTSPISGVAAALVGSACYAAAYIYARRFLAPLPHSPLSLSTGQMMAGAAILALAAPLFFRTPSHLPIEAGASVIALGVISTGIGYILTYRLIAEEGATSAALATYLVPIVAVTLAALLLREPVTWRLLVGAGTVLLGVAGAQGYWHRRGAVEHRRPSPTSAPGGTLYKPGEPHRVRSAAPPR
ncbi:MAG: DMT family transporter [Actinomycetota bacterium]